MSLVTLPEEILVIIIKKLDFKAVYSLYNTCNYTRNIIIMYGVVKECKLSLNTMATAQTLKLNFFKDVSEHLQVLNLCGVPDLFKTSLLPAMKRLKCLRSLDVSYTNINIIDFLDIYQVCPTIKDISINYLFSKLGQIPKILSEKVLKDCQNAFQYMENVHFVGNLINLLYSTLPSLVLQKAKLNNLKYTIVEQELSTMTIQNHTDPAIQFDYFSICILNWKGKRVSMSIEMIDLPINSMLNSNKYEFMILSSANSLEISAYASPLLQKFLREKFEINALCDPDDTILGSKAILIWNRETITFDDNFFNKLYDKIKTFIPRFFSSGDETPYLECDWFYTAEDPVLTDPISDEPEFKRKRVSPVNKLLNYDKSFQKNNAVKINIYFKKCLMNPMTLSPNTMFLKKITHLSLCGEVRYSSEFFNVLFRCCDNLTTFNVETTAIPPAAPFIFRSMPLSQTLKNFRMIDKRIDFVNLFSSLSQCRQLENVRILDKSVESNDLANPSLMFEKCTNLYSLYILASMGDTVKTKKLQMLNKVKHKCNKPYLYIELQNKWMCNEYFYDPYVGVFNLNPIKQI